MDVHGNAYVITVFYSYTCRHEQSEAAKTFESGEGAEQLNS